MHASLAGAIGGLLMVTGLFSFLGSLREGHTRGPGLAFCLLFQALGALLLVLFRGQRATTAGVVLFGVGVLPLLTFVFVDTDHPDRAVGSAPSFTSSATAVLLFSGLVWLAVYFFGPSRRYGFFLGFALLAFWLVAVIQIVDGPLDALVGTVDRASSSVGSGAFGYGSDPEDPTLTLGVVSALFAAAYLAMGRRADRRGDARGGTPPFAISIPIVTFSVVMLSLHTGAAGESVLYLAAGGVLVWLGAADNRRFTAWYGSVGIVVGIERLLADAFDTPRSFGVAATLVGLAVAVAAGRLEAGHFPWPPQLRAPTPPSPGSTSAAAPTADAAAWGPPPEPSPPTLSADPGWGPPPADPARPSLPPEPPTAGPTIDPSWYPRPEDEAPPPAS